MLNKIKQFDWKKFDYFLLVAVVLLCLIGAFVVRLAGVAIGKYIVTKERKARRQSIRWSVNIVIRFLSPMGIRPESIVAMHTMFWIVTVNSFERSSICRPQNLRH